MSCYWLDFWRLLLGLTHLPTICGVLTSQDRQQCHSVESCMVLILAVASQFEFRVSQGRSTFFSRHSLFLAISRESSESLDSFSCYKATVKLSLVQNSVFNQKDSYWGRELHLIVSGLSNCAWKVLLTLQSSFMAVVHCFDLQLLFLNLEVSCGEIVEKLAAVASTFKSSPCQ